ncbi:MAG: hypothetical protein KKE20_02860 [Nanoarchaeota archaeon]|nr:hypothetical protein [Nanoarchaeota archaeon]
MKGYFIAGLIIYIVLMTGCSGNVLNTCPDTELHDFNMKVENKEQAIGLLSEYFSEKNGYHAFNESRMFYAEDLKGYVYGDMYGYAGEGGVLQTDGKLIRKGYCK